MNETVFHFFNTLAGHNQFLDQVIIFCAVWLGNLALAATILFVFFHRDKYIEEHTKASLLQKTKELSLILSSAFSAWVAAQIFKHLFATERPFLALDVVPLFDHGGYAFPSGHATFFSALAVAVYFYHKGLGIALGAVAIIVGVARVIAGVHFPIDILGGFVLGPIVAIFAYKVLRFLARKLRIL